MRIFLTGASGFVGSAFATAFHQQHAILAMSRSEKSDAVIRSLGVTPVRCALGAVTPEHLQGCDVIVHCAAHVEQWGRREDFMLITVEGTRQLLQVARAAGVKRFVHISTEAVLFHGQDMQNIDERYPYPERHTFLYSESKAEAEKLVLAAFEPGCFETVSLRPRMIWGPGDQTILPVLLQMISAGRFMWMDDGRAHTSTTHIANLVHAMGLALSKGRGGEAYFVTDGPITTFREFLTALLATQGVTPPEKSVPGWLARGMGQLMEGIWRLLGIASEPPLTRFAAAIMSRECTIDISKARHELAYSPRITVERGLAEMPRLQASEK